MKNIFKNKIVLVFGAIFLLTILVFSLVIFNILGAKNEALAKLEANKEIIVKNEKIKTLSEKWQGLENLINSKRELIKNEKNQLELLIKNKLEIEGEIQSIRDTFAK
ncbi:hypothetical protein DLH72_01230 [Candidatus Gracilibacteria bacterium]|nr:MAG: hypothetical protein DLH72_01230 [Candidatus Gracilibacteria bacterium]